MRASSYLPLPEKLKAKQWCLNIQSIEKKWFLCPILVLLYPVQHRNHPNRVSKYQGYEHVSNMSGIQYPVGIKDIGKFKHQNNISVNVYGHQNKKIFPLRNNDNNKRYFCQCCLHGSTCEEVLKNHMERCKLYGAQRIKLLEAGDKKGCDKEKLKKQNSNYVYHLSSTRNSKEYYVNKTHVSHRHQNPSLPNTNITYHVGAASAWNSVVENTLNHCKWMWWKTPLKSFWIRS